MQNEENVEEKEDIGSKKEKEIEEKEEIEKKLKLNLEEETSKEKPKTNKDSYDSFTMNEIFILFFSLDSIELVDVIRLIEDENLKEFYMFLLIYLHEGQDFNVIYDFLERKTQFSLQEKYKTLCNYLEKKEEVGKLENNYMIERNHFNSSIE